MIRHTWNWQIGSRQDGIKIFSSVLILTNLESDRLPEKESSLAWMLDPAGEPSLQDFRGVVTCRVCTP